MSDKHRVLIADDNEPNVELLEAYLAGLDIQTEIAVDGQDTLDKVASFQPHVLLLDVMMPKMNGFEVTEKVRADPELNGTKIILLTAKGQDSDRATGEAAGADDYMTKPFSPTKLLERTRKILGAS